MTSHPTSVPDIVTHADARLAALVRHADALPDYAVTEDFRGDRVADVFAHLYGWHQLLLGWLKAEDEGVTPAFPAPGYSWEQLSELNGALISDQAHLDYSQLRDLLHHSHRDVCEALLARNDDALFSPTARPWLGGGSLGEVAHQCLGPHYEWGESMLGQCAL